MAQTKQQAAIGFYQAVIAANARLLDLYATILPLLAANTDEAYATTLANFPTAPVNPDGTVSSTPDASPVASNPIIIPTGAPLNKSGNALFIAVQNITDLKSFMENIAVAAGNRRANAQNVQ